MFSYFRNNHRRTGSNSSSPVSPQVPLLPDSNVSSPKVQRPRPPSPQRVWASDNSVPLAPPTLPPITRVSTQQEERARKKPKTEEGPKISEQDGLRYPPVPWRAKDVSPVLPPIPRIASTQDSDQQRPFTATHPYQAQQNVPPSIRSEIPLQRSQNRHSGNSQGQVDSLQAMLVSEDSYDLDERDTARSKHSTPSTSRSQSADPGVVKELQHTNPALASSTMSSNLHHEPFTQLPFEHGQGTTRTGLVVGDGKNAPRISKAKRNLLNPVSLLMRRKVSNSGDDIGHRNYESSVLTVPDNYDPRIRGKGVHDFNAPRPLRQPSTILSKVPSLGDPGPGSKPALYTPPNITADPGPSQNTDKEYSTAFIENFDDEEDQTESSSRARRESLANPAFVARVSRQLEDLGPVPGEPIREEDGNNPAFFGTRTSKGTDGSSVRPSSEPSTGRSSFSNDTGATSPPQSPPKSKSSTPTAVDDSSTDNTQTLRHLPSTASRISRFSFQLNSDGSNAQEKELEEMGKLKLATKPSKRDSRFDDLEEEEDLGMFDDIDEEDFDEEIPMVGEDSYLEPMANIGGSSLQMSHANVQFVAGFPQPTSALGYVPSVPIDAQEPPVWSHDSVNSGHESLEYSETSDSLYYHDGTLEIGDDETVSSVHESLLDTFDEFPTGHNDLGYDLSEQLEQLDIYEPSASAPYEVSESDSAILQTSENVASGPRTANVDRAINYDASADSLNAYHGALASAANKAAEEGKFYRAPSACSASSFYPESVQLSASTVEGDLTRNNTNNSHAEFEDYYEDLEDDSMVAAANAEVLASDDSEFYGQEFGFYSRPIDQDAQMYSGGYFGNALAEMKDYASMNHNALREPNLTPITERSEYSTRNSLISLSNQWNPLSTSVPAQLSIANQPGLKELVASESMNDDDLTLSQLMKLRKEAFGHAGRRSSFTGSSGSIEGSASGQLRSSPVQPKSSLSLSNYFGIPLSDEAAIEETGSELSDLFIRDSRQLKSSSSSNYARDDTEFVLGHTSQHDMLQNQMGNPNPLYASSAIQFPSTSLPTHAEVAPVLQAGHGSFPLQASDPIREEEEMSSPASPSTSGMYSLPQSPQQQAAGSMASSTPMPPHSMLQKLAQRPAVDGYRKSTVAPTHNRRRSLPGDAAIFRESIAYVQEEDPMDGLLKWYKERRRRLSSGELVIVDREVVEGGI